MLTIKCSDFLGGDALVSCGMVEALLKVINWHSTETEHITVSKLLTFS